MPGRNAQHYETSFFPFEFVDVVAVWVGATSALAVACV
jgi:hypothetical protein